MRGHIRCFICFGILASADENLDDIFAALGQELEREDCSLLGGRDCDAGTAFLQTKSAYRSLGATDMAPSFFQTAEEVTSETVGVVHGGHGSRDAEGVGEVHLDRSRQMREWQEDAVEIYADTRANAHSASAAKTAVTVVAATLSDSRGALTKMQVFLSASGLWLAVLFTLVIFLVGAMLARYVTSKGEKEQIENGESAPTAKEDVEEAAPVQFIPQPIGEPKERVSYDTGQSLCSELRRCFQEARLIGEEDLSSCLPEASGYDCALTRPANSGEALRMLVRIEGPLPGGPPPLGLLRAPLSQRSCVFFSAAVQESRAAREKADSSMPLLEKKVDAVDFQVSLVGAPSVRIDVSGSDLRLLDVSEDNWTPAQQLDSLPPPWRDFLSSDVATGSFCFREDVLLVGSQVVLCGELLRDSRGRIFLQPWEWSSTPEVGRESWRTSWEHETSKRPTVLASNDITLAEEPKVDSSPTFVPSFDTADFPQPFLML